MATQENASYYRQNFISTEVLAQVFSTHRGTVQPFDARGIWLPRLVVALPNSIRVVYSKPYLATLLRELSQAPTPPLPSAWRLQRLSSVLSLQEADAASEADLEEALSQRLQTRPDYPTAATLTGSDLHAVLGISRVGLAGLISAEPPAITPVNPEITRGRGPGHPGFLFLPEDVQNLYEWLPPGTTETTLAPANQ